MLRSLMGCFVHTGLGMLQCSRGDLRYAESTGTVPGKCDGYKPSESSLKDSSGGRNTLTSMLNPSCRCLQPVRAGFWLTNAELSPVPHHSSPIIPRDAGQAGVKALLPGHTQLTAASNAQNQGVPLSQKVIFSLFSKIIHFFPCSCSPPIKTWFIMEAVVGWWNPAPSLTWSKNPRNNRTSCPNIWWQDLLLLSALRITTGKRGSADLFY